MSAEKPAPGPGDQRVSPELELHERKFMQLRVVLDMYKKKQKSAKESWEMAKKLQTELTALSAKLSPEDHEDHAVHVDDRLQLEEEFLELRQHATMADMPDSLRSAPAFDVQEYHKHEQHSSTFNTPIEKVHPLRRLCIPGTDNDIVNQATCGMWNNCGGDGRLNREAEMMANRLHMKEAYASRRVPAPRPYLP
jgi:type VI protein secretion system component VasK